MFRHLVSLFRVGGAALLWSVLVSVLWVLLLGVVPVPVTWLMADQAREQNEFHRTWMPLDRISRQLPLAVIAAEDQKFMDHFGFDMEAIRKAMDRNERNKGKRIRGASTISQQAAKNVFLWPGRTWLRKGAEAWFTLLIEAFWSKERVLEVYLNVVEMGKGTFGAEAVARHCFGRPAAKLSPAQAALIAAGLPAPRRSNCTRPSGYLLRRQQWVLRQMRNIGDVLDRDAPPPAKPKERRKNT